MLATNMINTTIGKKMFAGIVLLSPFYRHGSERMYENERLINAVAWFRPNTKWNNEFDEKPDWYKKEYKKVIDDPKFVYHATAKTLQIFIDEQRKARQSIEGAP